MTITEQILQNEVASLETFEDAATRTLQRLRSTLLAVISAIPGSNELQRAADLERALGIRSTLAWQLYKVARADNPIAEARHVPGPGAMKRFLQAAKRAGVSSEFTQAVSQAMDELGGLIKTHAGTRKTFDSMISALADQESDGIDLQYKRSGYACNSHIFGAHANVHLSSFFAHPAAANSNRLDFLGIHGLLGLQRIRHDVPWVVSRTGFSDDDGEIRESFKMESLDPNSEFGLLQDFCSTPLPTLETDLDGSGDANVVLRANGIGIKSAISCPFGKIARNSLSRYKDDHNQVQRCQTRIRTPCRLLINDIFIYEGTFGDISPEVLVYGDHRDVDAVILPRTCDLLATKESVVYLGKGPSVLHTTDVPRYPEMAQYAFDRMGWDGERFDVYRCRVDYPIMPSSVVVQFELPEKGQV